MTSNELSEAYFNWMYNLVNNPASSLSYRKLFQFLNKTDFYYTLPKDANRYADGIDLRYRFGEENGYDISMIASLLDTRPCSVLEMMIALALRCEESIMHDAEQGDRMSQWFWLMLVNLGISYMSDDIFEEKLCKKAIDKFLNREYKPNGFGGLFTVEGHGDIRNVEIWYQMNWFLNQNYL